jgi:hypothetical protein
MTPIVSLEGGSSLSAKLIELPVSGVDTTAPVSVPAEAEAPTPPPSRSLTLWDIETNLQALADSVESVEPEQEQQFLEDFRQALIQAKEKRDRVGRFLAYCEAMGDMASKEITRLQKRKDFYLRTVERLEGYVEKILRDLGQDEKGKWRKLEGDTSSFGLRNLPPSTIITDEAAVPTACKTVTVTLPAPLWEQVVDSLDMDLANQVLDAVKKPNSTVSKMLVKDAIEQKVPNWKELLKNQPSVFTPEVPGAAIAAGGTKLVRG